MSYRKTRKGKRKYICQDCNEEFFLHWIERQRARRESCPTCGSYFIIPKSSGAVEQIIDEGRNIVQYKDNPHRRGVIKKEEK